MSQFAFFFPGQGSQSVGMMAGLSHLKVIKETFEEASDILNTDLWAMATEPNELLNLTQHTQPLMLTAGVATWRAYQALAGATIPTVMAGHSLGEYTALVAANALTFKDALPLVKFRAEAMQNAVPEGMGGMAAVLGLEDDAVREVCVEAASGQVLEPVNFNSPGQIVIAGNKEAVERAIEVAKSKGAKRVLPLPVSVPSHCALMKTAAQSLADYLDSVSINQPICDVIQNSDVQVFKAANDIKNALVKQLYSPVRWVETINAVYQQGIVQSAEVGPGKVLAGLVKRTKSELACSAFVDEKSMLEFIQNIY